MRSLNFAFLLLFFAVLYSGCKSEDTINNSVSVPVDTSQFNFPFDISNYWNYESVSTVSDIRPDSIVHYFSEYPLHGSGTLRIVKDTLMNGVTTRQFVDTYIQDSSTYTSKIYYINTDTTLIQFAYSLQSSTDIFPKFNNRIFIKHGDRIFRSMNELITSCRLNAEGHSDDTLIYENPAPEALRYPIVTNYQWTFRNFGQSILTKKYLNFENLSIGHLTLSCIKTEFKWSTIDYMESYQYYSKHGKLRNYLFMNDATVSNEFGQTLGTIDIKDITNVTSYYVVEIMP